nr:WD40 repeat domain-containing protein [Wenjunlia tyrosinilytica]
MTQTASTADGSAQPGGRFEEQLAALAGDLRRLRIQRGAPSLRGISARAAQGPTPLSVSALSEAFKGKRLPRLDFFMALVRTLLCFDEDGQPHAPVGTAPEVAAWRTRWQAVETARVEDLRRTGGSPRPPRTTAATAAPTVSDTHPADQAARSTDSTDPQTPARGHEPQRAAADVRVPYKEAPVGAQRPEHRSRPATQPIPNDFWCTATLTGHTGPVVAVAFSPDGHLLATTSLDHTVRLWNPTTRQPIGNLTGHTSTVRAVAFSPDGHQLATAGEDKTVRLYEAQRPERALEGRIGGPAARALLGTLSTGESVPLGPVPNVGPVFALAFSPDAYQLATASQDKTVRLWNPATQQPIGTPLTGHTAPVYVVAFSPDGHLLATAGMTPRCGCGTRPPNNPSATPSPATPTRSLRWRSPPTDTSSPPPAVTGRCGCGSLPDSRDKAPASRAKGRHW